jgi:hypothetical protein
MFRTVSPLELAACVLTFAGVFRIISLLGAARRDGVPVKRWAIAPSIFVMVIGIATGTVGVATGVVSLV